jgi:putative ABC transport system permease protein
MLLLLQALLRTSLLADWQRQLPPGTPNHFMLNLVADELPVLEQFFADKGLVSEPAYPLVRGRLMTINDTPLTQYLQNNEELSGSLDRELGLTWSASQPAHNQLLAGRWWDENSASDEVSVEYELAQKLGLKLGDSLVFQIADSRFEVTVSSFRQLDWESMRPNFFMMFPPSVLAQYPATYMTSFYLPPEQKTLLNALVKMLPTSSVIEMDVVIGQVRSIVGKVSGAVELVLLLIVVSGLLVLIASVQSGIEGRLRDSAVLRTLGASRRLLSGSLLLEFAILGFLSGLLAAGAAELSVYLLQTVSLDMRYIPHPWVWLVGPLLGALLVSVVGYLASRRVVDQPPLVTLREVN